MTFRCEIAAWDWAIQKDLDPFKDGQEYKEGYEQAEKWMKEEEA